MDEILYLIDVHRSHNRAAARFIPYNCYDFHYQPLTESAERLNRLITNGQRGCAQTAARTSQGENKKMDAETIQRLTGLYHNAMALLMDDEDKRTQFQTEAVLAALQAYKENRIFTIHTPQTVRPLPFAPLSKRLRQRFAKLQAAIIHNRQVTNCRPQGVLHTYTVLEATRLLTLEELGWVLRTAAKLNLPIVFERHSHGFAVLVYEHRWQEDVFPEMPVLLFRFHWDNVPDYASGKNGDERNDLAFAQIMQLFKPRPSYQQILRFYRLPDLPETASIFHY